MTRKRSHTLSHTLLGFILLIMLASPTVASAQPPASANMLTQDDIEFIFGPEANIAAFKQLSPQEMAETQGEFFGGSTLRLLNFFKSITIRTHYDIKPHRFSGYWGPLKGNRPHFQITIYRRGVPNSDINIRIPWGSRTSWGSHRR